MILILIGKKCSGKTFIRECLEKELACKTFEASYIINKMKKKLNISDSKEILNRLGYDYAAKIIAKNIDIKYINIISGFRTQNEIRFIKLKFKNVVVIEIYAPTFICYLRNIKRNRYDKENNPIKFFFMIKKDNLLWKLNNIRNDGLIDYKINNICSKNRVLTKIRNIIYNLNSSKNFI
jgi:dephospho-CoA kinase